MKDSSVYIHIPFCAAKCGYCDFLSFTPGPGDEDRYFEALRREILNSDRVCGRIDTVFVGGGTPSVVSASYIADILDTLRMVYTLSPDAEISIESNPNSLSLQKLKAYRSEGINRLSMGVQSFDDTELGLLGRLHRAGEAERAFFAAREAGFENINLDLMSALPGQSLQSLARTLDKAVELAPEHLSVYSLILEEGTPFFEKYGCELSDGKGCDCESAAGKYSSSCVKEPGGLGSTAPLPDEDEILKMDELVRSRLRQAGYQRYEISNFAKSGLECRHNLGYWRRKSYRGYGLGAASLIRFGDREYRFGAETDMESYIAEADKSIFDRERAKECVREVSLEERMEEFMFLGLRCTRGIDEREFTACFGCDIISVYGDTIKKQMEAGYLEREEHFFRYNPAGLDVSNILLSDFLL